MTVIQRMAKLSRWKLSNLLKRTALSKTQSLEGLFRRLFPPSTKSDAQSLSLCHLPLEIIHYIVSFLSTTSAAALAFCSHSMLFALGTKHWDDLRAMDYQERNNFLSILERDLPKYILCYQCAKLHLSSLKRTCDPYVPAWLRKRPCFINCGLDWYYPEQYFRYEHAHMAMKQHRLGLDSATFLNYISATKTIYQYTHTYQFSIEPRIRYGELFFRSQHRLLLPKGLHVTSEDIYMRVRITYRGQLCPHLGCCSVDEELWSKLLDCVTSYLTDQHHCTFYSGLKNCRYCPMEYEINTKSFGKHGSAIFITKWQNLGSCTTISDPMWQSHHYCPMDDDPPRQEFDFEAGTIKASFEGQNVFDFNSIITQADEKELLHNRYLNTYSVIKQK